MRKIIKVSALLVVLFWSFSAHAGGLHLYEIGTTDLGLAGAGQAACAEDASTVYGNPAGMTRLAGNQFALGYQGRYAEAPYDLNGSGVPSGNVGGFHQIPSFFYSHSVSDRLKLGMGLYANYGLLLDFGPWAGSAFVEEISTTALSLQPTAAYRLDEKWSVGGGLVISYGATSLERTQGGVKLEQDDEDWSYGVRLGVTYEPSDATRIGFVWQNKIEHHYSMTWTAGNPYSYYGRMLGKSVRPEERMLSVRHRLTPDWAVMGNVGWQGWSKFSNDGLENRSYNGPLRFRNTWHVALGAQYAINAATKWNVGIAHDTSLYKSQQDTALILPNGAVWRVGTGIQYALSKTCEVGAAFEYLRAQGSYDQHPALSGRYDHPQIYFLALSYLHKF